MYVGIMNSFRAETAPQTGWQSLPLTVTLLNHLVSPEQERLRDCQPQRLCGLEVDHQFELRRLLDRKIRRPGALQDLIDIGDGGPMEIRLAYVISHQATAVDGERRISIDRRQSVAGRKFGYSCALNTENALGRREESFGVLPGPSVERRRKVIGGSDIADLQCHAQRRSRLLQCLHL